MPQTFKVGIIGDGNVGTALTRGLTRAGHEVRSVGKEPAKVKEIATWADTLVLAVPFKEHENALAEMGDAVKGKPLLDVTNVADDKLEYGLGLDKSGAERVQEKAKGAKVVKAFNTVFAQNMDTGRVHGERLTTFVAGDDAQAKQRALQFARDIGFDAVDAGPLRNARWLETLAILTMQLGYKQDLGPAIGFKLVHEGNVGASAEGSATRERTA